MARTINAPGIEINEIDRSSYDAVDNSMVGTLGLVLGFADQGEDYEVKWINSMGSFEKAYGTPSNEAERYLYNSVREIIDSGGIATVGKLPYDNHVLDKFAYTEYQIGTNFDGGRDFFEISSISDIFWTENTRALTFVSKMETIKDIADQTDYLWYYTYGKWDNCKTIYDISSHLSSLANVYGYSTSVSEVATQQLRSSGSSVETEQNPERNSFSATGPGFSVRQAQEEDPMPRRTEEEDAAENILFLSRGMLGEGSSQEDQSEVDYQNVLSDFRLEDLFRMVQGISSQEGYSDIPIGEVRVISGLHDQMSSYWMSTADLSDTQFPEGTVLDIGSGLFQVFRSATGEEYSPEKFTLTFEYGFGPARGTQEREVLYDSRIGSFPTNTPVYKEGTTTRYNLSPCLGWYTLSAAGTEMTEDTVVSSDLTCYGRMLPRYDYRLEYTVQDLRNLATAIFYKLDDVDGDRLGQANRENRDIASLAGIDDLEYWTEVFLRYFLERDPKDYEKPVTVEDLAADLEFMNVRYDVGYKRKTWRVSFVTDGGQPQPDDRTVYDYCRIGRLPDDVKRAGYTFLGWNLGDKRITPDYVVTGEGADEQGIIYLVAAWKEGGSTVTVSFSDGYDGRYGTMEPQKFQIGVPQNLNKCTMVREEYIFLGWNKTKGSQEVQYQDGGQFTTESDVTLYAVWKYNRNSPVLTLDPDGGTFTGSVVLPEGQAYRKNCAYGEYVELEDYTVARTGYTFLGWYDSKDGGDRIYNVTMTGSVTLYARWRSDTPPPPPIIFNTIYDLRDAVDSIYKTASAARKTGRLADLLSPEYLRSLVNSDDVEDKEYGERLYGHLSGRYVDFSAGLVEYVLSTCYFPEYVNEEVSEILDPQVFASTGYLQEILSSGYSAESVSRPEISVIAPFVREMYSSERDLLDRYMKTVSLGVLEDSYVQISSYLSNTEMSGFVDGFIKPDVAQTIFSTPYTELRQFDEQITSVVKINGCIPLKNNLMTFEQFDDFAVGYQRPRKGHIVIVDITRRKYQADDVGKEYLGTVPVLMTASNALYYQKYLLSGSRTSNAYTILGSIQNTKTQSTGKTGMHVEGLNFKTASEIPDEVVGFSRFLGDEMGSGPDDYTVSMQAARYFPQIQFQDDRVKVSQLKLVGLVVFKMFKDLQNDGKIDFQPVESFVGSLNKWAVDENTGASIFLDNIVNQNSGYVNMFSNLEFSKTGENPTDLDKASVFAIGEQAATSLGFYSADSKKTISVRKSILQAMDRIFDNYKDSNKIDIDVVCDAGVSNIGQFIASTYPSTSLNAYQRKGYYDFNSDSSYMFKMDTRGDVSVWASIIQKFDNFSKNMRKDCIFVADGPRQMVLDGQLKKIRKTRTSSSVMQTIVPKMRMISNIVNSSYSAGYVNWFQVQDAFSGQYFWCPPSIKAMGAYIRTDRYSNYWDAPAGMNRGVVEDALDISFNPTSDEAGYIYTAGWNYAMSYPAQGIVLEGQKTFQTNRTALDRINVRRLLLGLEKATRNYAKYFNYEGNTEWLRQRFKDVLDRYFEEVRSGGGLNDFLVVCDDRNNTPQTIDNNELHVQIYVKPVKAIEFIVLNFVCTNQSANIEEMAESDLG